MAKIDTYGLKMVGIRYAAGLSKNLDGYFGGHYLQIFYTRSTGEIRIIEHVGTGSSCYSEDPDLISCGYIYSPCTMQEIADLVLRALKRRD